MIDKKIPIINANNGKLPQNINKKESENKELPKMMTIREIAATGIQPEYALRTLVREGRLPAIRCGTAVRINLNTLIDLLNDTNSILYMS